MKNTKEHLCDSCERYIEYPECADNDLEFGDGYGNDNIIKCDNFIDIGGGNEKNN